ncbi:MAG: thioredoxin [Candidatus Omnitrophota bacterium]|nr:MAG: thioredoxin [Candidatus Omnitrophota bacterium]
MEKQNHYVINVSQQTFEADVVRASFQKTVVIDFWAQWCAPCRQLTPILEKVVASYGGQAILAKINVDENQWLCQQFGVQSIPAVKIVQQGKLVDEFVGALPEAEIRNILSQHIGGVYEEDAEDDHDAEEEDVSADAEERLRAILEKDPQNSHAQLRLAKIALEKNDPETASELLHAIELGKEEYNEAEGLLNKIEFIHIAKESAGKAQLRNNLAANENDPDSRYALACCLAAEGEYEPALEEFLTIVKRNKNYKEGIAVKAMVKVFSIIGQRHALSDAYRDKLEWLLY